MLLDDTLDYAEMDLLVDKEKLAEWLTHLENGALGLAFKSKEHVAVKAYAQAAAFKYVLSAVLGGEFDFVNEDTVIN